MIKIKVRNEYKNFSPEQIQKEITKRDDQIVSLSREINRLHEKYQIPDEESRFLEYDIECSSETDVLTEVFYNAPVGISIVKDRRIIRANPYIYKLLKYKQSELDGQSVKMLYKSEEEYKRIGQEKYSELDKAGYTSFETQFVRKDGSSLDVLLTASFSDLNDSSKHVVAAVQDISKLKNLERSLMRSNTGKDKLFSIVSHDLKGPIQNINGFIELLYKNFDVYSDEKKKKFIGLIHDSSHTIFQLIENLLLWSRSQLSSITYSPDPFNLIDLVRKNLELYKTLLNKKGVKPQILMDESIRVFADSSMVDTVVRNLLSNALKFSNQGDEIIIFTEEQENMIRVGIRDGGIGINEKRLQKLFYPNDQNTTRGTEGEKGSGLGLVICKDFIEMNEGEIWAESEIGKGSVFYFTLPKA